MKDQSLPTPPNPQRDATREATLDALEGERLTISTTLKKVDDKGTKGIIVTAENLNDLHKHVVAMYKNGTDKSHIEGFVQMLDFLDSSYRAHFERGGV